MNEQPKPPRNLLPALIAGFAIAGIVLVVVGRLTEAGDGSGWQDPLYSVFLAFTFDGSFLGRQSPITLVGALLAGLATYIALIGGALVLSRRGIVSWRAARSKDHFVIIGDDAGAEELARQLASGQSIVLVSAREILARNILAIERPVAVSALIATASINRAKAVVVMLADEKLNASLATSIAAGREGAANPTIWCRVGDRPIADRVAGAAFGAARILVFDDAEMMAREAFARHPSHAAAERMAADRVHIVIAGFGRLGQAMAEEAIFSGIAHGLGKPMVTVLDKHAAAVEGLYRAARPALDVAADFAFIEIDLVTAALALRAAQPAFDALALRDDIARVTGIALCLPTDADNIRLGLALPELRRREGRYFAPSFLRARDSASIGLVVDAAEATIVDPNQGAIPLERASRLIATAILDADRRDSAARALHEAYHRADSRSPGASADWNRLPETYRRTNRHSADHIGAKLFALGLTSERDPHAPAAVRRGAFESLLKPLCAGESKSLAMLAALEHRRWSADRIIDGWSYGAIRDDDLKHHPLLETADYGDLPPAEQSKDRDQIRTIASSIVATDGVGAMLETRVALAGHRNLAPAEEQRGVAALVATLCGRLAAMDRVVTLVSPLAPGADMALTEAVAVALAGKVGALRLIQVEAVPYRVVLERAASEISTDDEASAGFIEAMLKRRQALFRRCSRVDMVRIGFTGKTDDSYRRNKSQFDAGAARANAYLARRADLLGVLWDGKPGHGLGGTGDLVNYWRDPALIPAELDPGVSPARPAALRGQNSLIVVPVQRDEPVLPDRFQ